MKKIFLFLLSLSFIALLGVGRVYAAEVSIPSDTSTQYFNGTEYVDSIATWTHSAWQKIPGATWIWNSFYTTKPRLGETVDFRKSLEVPGIPMNAEMEVITADNEFTAFLNGTYFEGGDDWRTTHTHSLSLTQGLNILDFSVINWPYNTEDSEINPGGLIYMLSFDDAPTLPSDLHFMDGSTRLECGSVTEATSIKVDWDDSQDSSDVKYNYEIKYPTTSGSKIWTTVKSISEHSGAINIGTSTVWVQAEDSYGHKSEWTEGCSITRVEDDNDDIYVGDLCLETPAENSIIGKLGVNRWIWDGEGSRWITTEPKGNANGYDKSFSMEDTYGCSCIQILDEINVKTGDKLGGHYKFGCSQSIIEAWRDNLYNVGPTLIQTIEVPASDSDGVSSTATLDLEKDYFLKAYGTARACWAGSCHITFDAEYSNSQEDLSGGWDDGVAAPYDTYGPDLLDLMVDGQYVEWGGYNELNTYQIPYEGTGTKLHLKIYDLTGSYSNDFGSLYVDLLEDRWTNLW